MKINKKQYPQVRGYCRCLTVVNVHIVVTTLKANRKPSRGVAVVCGAMSVVSVVILIQGGGGYSWCSRGSRSHSVHE